MGRSFKEEAKFHKMSNGDLAKALNISEDRITAMNNDIESVSVKRVVDSYDIMGADPTEMIRGLSKNRFARDGIDKEIGSRLKATRNTLFDLLGNRDISTEWCQRVAKAVEISHKFPLIYITGGFGCGKYSLLQNLLGKDLKLLGPDHERSYAHFLAISDSRAGIEFNYPFGEYLYRIDDPELIPELLNRDGNGKMYSDGLKPAVNGSTNSSEGDYVVFTDSPSLNTINIVCGNQLSIFPDSDRDITAAKTDAQLLGIADVMIIMLNGHLDALYLTNIMRLLRYACERWGSDTHQHVMFVISKADLLVREELNEIKDDYLKILSNEIDANDEQLRELIAKLPDMIFPYSSIYKIGIDSGKNDAVYNWQFYNRLNQLLLQLTDCESRNKLLSEILDGIEMYCSSENEISSENISRMKAEVSSIAISAESSFKLDFLNAYDEILNSGHISRIIREKKLTRKQEDRHTLISDVTAQLSDAAVRSVHNTLENMMKAFSDSCESFLSASEMEALRGKANEVYNYVDLTLLPTMESRISGAKIAKANSISKASPGLLGRLIAASAIVTLPGLLPIVPIVTGTAGAMAMSYYAQTNFEKNMSKKIVSAFEEKNVRWRLAETMIYEYLRPMKDRLLLMIDSFNSNEDKNALELIEDIRRIIES